MLQGKRSLFAHGTQVILIALYRFWTIFSDKMQDLRELQLSLSTAQRTISELRSQEARDWVIPRDEIQITEKCLGRGLGWGSVNEGRIVAAL